MALSPVDILIRVIDRATGEIGQITRSLGLISFAYNEINMAIATVSSVSGKFYDLLIGQNVELQNQLLATKASLVATQQVIRDGQAILDPTAAINALEKPVAAAIEKLRRDSLDLVGVTSSELVPVFQVVAQQSASIGANLSDAEKLTVSFSAALGTIGLPLRQAGQEIGSILRGTIDQNSYLAKNLGINNQMVAQWKAQGTVVQELTKRLEPFVAGNKLAAQTITGIASNIREVTDTIFRLAGAPLVKPLVGALDYIYQGLKQNQDEIVKFFTQDLPAAIAPALNAIETLRPGVMALIEALSSFGAAGADVLLGLLNGLSTAAGLVLTALAPLIEVLASVAQFLGDALNTPLGQVIAQFLVFNLVIKPLIASLTVFAVRSLAAAVLAVIQMGTAISSVTIPSLVSMASAILTGTIPAITALITALNARLGAALARAALQLIVVGRAAGNTNLQAFGASLGQLGVSMAGTSSSASTLAGTFGRAGTAAAAAGGSTAGFMASLAAAAPVLGLVAAAAIAVVEAYSTYDRITKAAKPAKDAIEGIEAAQEKLNKAIQQGGQQQKKSGDKDLDTQTLDKIKEKQGVITKGFEFLRSGLGQTTEAQAQFNNQVVSFSELLDEADPQVEHYRTLIQGLQKGTRIPKEQLEAEKEALDTTIKSLEDVPAPTASAAAAQAQLLKMLRANRDELSKFGDEVTLAPKPLKELGDAQTQLAAKADAALRQIREGAGGNDGVFQKSAKDLIEITKTQLEQGLISQEEATKRLEAVKNDKRTEVDTILKAEKEITGIVKSQIQLRAQAYQNQVNTLEIALAQGNLTREEFANAGLAIGQEQDRKELEQLELAKSKISATNIAALQEIEAQENEVRKRSLSRLSQYYDARVKIVEEASQKTKDIIAAAATTRELEIQGQRNKGKLDEQQYQEELALSNKVRLKDEITATVEHTRALQALPKPKTAEEVRKQEANIRKSLAETAKLRLELSKEDLRQVQLVEAGRVKKIEAANEQAARIYTEAEQKRQEILAASALGSKKLTEDLAATRLAIESDRIKSELVAEQEKLDKLRALPPVDDPEIVKQRQREIATAVLQSSKLRIEQLQNEYDRTEALYDLQQRRTSEILESQKKLVEAQDRLATKLADVAKRDLQERLNYAKSDAERAALKARLYNLERTEVERQIAQTRLALELDIQRNQALAERERSVARLAALEAKQATNKAQQDLGNAIKSGDKTAIDNAQKTVEIAQEGERLAGERVALADKNIEREVAAASAQRQLADLEAADKRITVEKEYNPSAAASSSNIRAIRDGAGLYEEQIIGQLQKMTSDITGALKQVVQSGIEGYTGVKPTPQVQTPTPLPVSLAPSTSRSDQQSEGIQALKALTAATTTVKDGIAKARPVQITIEQSFAGETPSQVARSTRDEVLGVLGEVVGGLTR